MREAKNQEKTVRILWKATGYPVHWVEKPDEVPLWDTSTGFSLTAGASCFMPGTFSPPYELEDLQRMDRYDYNSGLMPAKTEKWQPLPTPKVGYPRLVRTDCATIVLGEYRQDEDVLSELACHAHNEEVIEPWRQGKLVKVLKRKVAQLAEKYGPPYDLKQNTLFSWLSLIQHVDIHLRAMEQLNKHDGFALAEYLEARREAIKARMESSTRVPVRDPSHPFLYRFPLYFRSTEDTLKEEEDLTDLQIEISGDLDEILPDNDEPFEPSLDELELIQVNFLLDVLEEHRVISKNEVEGDDINIGAFKQLIAEKLFSNIDLKITAQKGPDPGLTLTLDGFVLRCPVGVWVDYRLAEAWREGLLLQVCERCNSVFSPWRRGLKYCKRGSCKESQSSKRRKGSAKARTS